MNSILGFLILCLHYDIRKGLIIFVNGQNMQGKDFSLSQEVEKEAIRSIKKNIKGNCRRKIHTLPFSVLLNFSSNYEENIENPVHDWLSDPQLKEDFEARIFLPSLKKKKWKMKEKEQYLLTQSMPPDPLYTFANSDVLQLLKSKWRIDVSFNTSSLSLDYHLNLSDHSFPPSNRYLPRNHYRNHHSSLCIQAVVEAVKFEALTFPTALSSSKLLTLSERDNLRRQSLRFFQTLQGHHHRYHWNGRKETNISSLSSSEVEDEEYEEVFYLVVKDQVLLYPNGLLLSSCGYYIPWDENCEFLSPATGQQQQSIYHEAWRKCVSGIQRFLPKSSQRLDSLWTLLFTPNPAKDLTTLQQKRHYASLVASCSFQAKMPQSRNVYETALLLSNQWDYNYYHFLIDSLTRLMPLLPYLRANPSIVIILRGYEEVDPSFDRQSISISSEDSTSSSTFLTSRDFAKEMRYRLFELLGLSRNRIILLNPNANLVIRRLLLPRGRACGEILSQTFLIRQLSQELKEAAKVFKQKFSLSSDYGRSHYPYTVGAYDRTKPNAVILQRYSSGLRPRTWTHWQFDLFLQSLQESLSSTHNIVYISSVNITRRDYCFACLIEEMGKADLLIGHHGAGLTNMMFMNPQSIVFELLDQINDVNLPLCGYYHSLATVFHHHYYIYGLAREKKVLGVKKQAQALAEKVSQVYSLLQRRT